MTTQIVHLIGQLGRGGAEKQLFRLTSALQNRGWTQAVISLSEGGLWRERLQSAGIATHEIPRYPSKIRRYWRLWRLIRHERPAIAVSWSAHVAVLAHLLRGVGPLRRVINVRLDPTVDVNTGKDVPLLFGYRAAVKKADFVVSNSAWAIQALRRVGVNPLNSKVVCNIVSAPGGASAAAPVETPRIVAVGSLKPRKAIDETLQALGILASEGRRFEFLVAGDGSDKPRLQTLAAQLGIADRVQFLGDVNDVPQLLASAQLLVHLSRNEGLSNAILEAMAAGLPVVASSAGGNPEIVQEGRTGFLTPPERPDLSAAAIRRLLDDADLRGRLGHEALAIVRARCGEAAVVAQYEEVFHRLLGIGEASAE